MAYGEYKDAGRCSGKCLYQLSRIGVPLQVIEEVIFSSDDHIKFRGKDFALVEWDFDTPRFVFEEGFEHYALLQDRYQIEKHKPQEETKLLHLVADHVSVIHTGDCGFVAVCVNPKTKKSEIPLREIFDNFLITDSSGEFDSKHIGFIVLKVETFPVDTGLYIMHVTVGKV
jgi:hypothetical protein